MQTRGEEHVIAPFDAERKIPIREAGESKPESVLSARINILATRMIRSSRSCMTGSCSPRRRTPPKTIRCSSKVVIN